MALPARAVCTHERAAGLLADTHDSRREHPHVRSGCSAGTATMVMTAHKDVANWVRSGGHQEKSPVGGTTPLEPELLKAVTKRSPRMTRAALSDRQSDERNRVQHCLHGVAKFHRFRTRVQSDGIDWGVDELRTVFIGATTTAHAIRPSDAAIAATRV